MSAAQNINTLVSVLVVGCGVRLPYHYFNGLGYVYDFCYLPLDQMDDASV